MPYQVRALVLAKLREVLGLEPVAPALPTAGLPEVVLPVIDVAPVLRQSRVLDAEATATAGQSGNLWVHTVPNGERWHLVIVRAVRRSGDNTFGHIVMASQASGYQIYLTPTSGGLTDLYIRFEVPIPLEEGDTLGVVLDGAGTTDSVVGMAILYWREQLF